MILSVLQTEDCLKFWHPSIQHEPRRLTVNACFNWIQMPLLRRRTLYVNTVWFGCQTYNKNTPLKFLHKLFTYFFHATERSKSDSKNTLQYSLHRRKFPWAWMVKIGGFSNVHIHTIWIYPVVLSNLRRYYTLYRTSDNNLLVLSRRLPNVLPFQVSIPF